MDKNEIGRRGEDAAAAYLKRIGYVVVDRNWRTKAGEVDIVAIDGSALVLVEVKTRRTQGKGSPEEAVSPTKQKKLIRLARAYIAHAGIEHMNVRFDVVAIRVLSDERALLRHHRAAFNVT